MASNLIFSDEFIDKVPIDLIDGVVFICRAFFNNVNGFKNGPYAVDELSSAHAILFNYLKSNGVEPGDAPSFQQNREKLLKEVSEYFRPIYNQYDARRKERDARLKFEKINAHVASKFGNYIIYELTDNQIKEIQALIDALRNKISDCDELEDYHRQRLLKKLEKLQSELHKKMTDFDRYYGLVVETNLLYQNFKEAHPLYQIAIKMANIVLETMTIANGLPVTTLSQLPF